MLLLSSGLSQILRPSVFVTGYVLRITLQRVCSTRISEKQEDIQSEDGQGRRHRQQNGKDFAIRLFAVLATLKLNRVFVTFQTGFLDLSILARLARWNSDIKMY